MQFLDALLCDLGLMAVIHDRSPTVSRLFSMGLLETHMYLATYLALLDDNIY